MLTKLEFYEIRLLEDLSKNQQVIANRKKLYGSWESQLEEIYDNGIDSWKARIAQIKADNPKENS